MGAVRTKVLADLGHRRLQVFVIAAVMFLAAGASTTLVVTTSVTVAGRSGASTRRWGT